MQHRAGNSWLNICDGHAAGGNLGPALLLSNCCPPHSLALVPEHEPVLPLTRLQRRRWGRQRHDRSRLRQPQDAPRDVIDGLRRQAGGDLACKLACKLADAATDVLLGMSVVMRGGGSEVVR
jgi:hypothetical protein